MIKNVIDLLNENKKLAISRLKKGTVEDKRQRELRNEQMLEALKSAFSDKLKPM